MDCFYADRSFLRSRQRRKKKGILISLCLVLFCLSLLHLLNREERQLPPSTLSRRRHDGWMAMGFRASIGRREKRVHLWARHFRLVFFFPLYCLCPEFHKNYTLFLYPIAF